MLDLRTYSLAELKRRFLNPTSLYLFNEGGGTSVRDEIGRGHLASVGNPPWSRGPFGREIVLNGTDEWLVTANHLGITSYPFTVAWFGRWTAGAGVDDVMGVGDNSVTNINYNISISGSEAWNIRRRNTTLEASSDGTSVVSNKYYLVALVCASATDAELFLDGVSDSFDGDSVTFSSNVDIMVIGKRPNSSSANTAPISTAWAGVWNSTALNGGELIRIYDELHRPVFPIDSFFRSAGAPVENTPVSNVTLVIDNAWTLDVSGDWSGSPTFGNLQNAPPGVSISSAGVFTLATGQVEETDLGNWPGIVFDGTNGEGTVESAPFTIRFGIKVAKVLITPKFSTNNTPMVKVTYVVACDENAALTADIEIPVLNRAPVVAALSDVTHKETDSLTINVTASDADQDIAALSMSIDGEPSTDPKLTFVDDGDNTGRILLATGANPGVFDVEIQADDGDALNALSGAKNFQLTIQQAPIGVDNEFSVNKNSDLTFLDVLDNDEGGTPPLIVLSISNEEHGTFAITAGGIGIDFTPDEDFSGDARCTYVVEDALNVDGMADVVVHVNNRAPVFQAISPKSVKEGIPLSFGIVVTDADGDTITIGAENLPPGMVKTDNGDGTGNIFWPNPTPSKLYLINLIARDDNLPVEGKTILTVPITVKPPFEADAILSVQPAFSTLEVV